MFRLAGHIASFRDRRTRFRVRRFGFAGKICHPGTKSSTFSRVRVLIADDEKLFTGVLAEMVRTCGHDVVAVVHSGLDAIRSYRQHKPDVVLMDFGMARLNGLTACRNILSEDPNGCILFLSGLGERVELTPEASGAFAVLQKPIEHAQLDQALRNASQHRTGGKGSTAVSADSEA